MTPWLVVPVKAFAAGKSRLAAVLGAAEREALNEELLCRILATARGYPGLARTAVVSDCDRALACASAAGALAIRQRSGPGLNEATAEGLDALARRGAERVLVVACDLPLLEPRDLRELGALARDARRVVLCPDKHGLGTNAIALPADARFDFRFGVASYAAHVASAERAGLTAVRHFNARIAFDVDTPEDLTAWRLREIERPEDARLTMRQAEFSAPGPRISGATRRGTRASSSAGTRSTVRSRRLPPR